MVEFLNAKGIPPIEINGQMQAIYGDDDCVALTTECHWAKKKCKDGELGRADLCG